MIVTQTYRVQRKQYWYFIGSKPFFNYFQFELDSNNQLWFISEPADFMRSETLLGISKTNGGLMQTELARVEMRTDNRMYIRLHMYLNLFSKYLLRVQSWGFTVTDRSEEDYNLLSQYKDGTIGFWHKL